MFFLIVLAMLSVYTVRDIEGLMCYSCNSLYDPECNNLQVNSTYSYHYHYCDPQDENGTITEYTRLLCRKIKQKIRVRQNLEIIKRSCGWELYKNIDKPVCYQNKNEDYEETVCQCFENGCNKSATTFANCILIFVFGGLFIYLL